MISKLLTAAVFVGLLGSCGKPGPVVAPSPIETQDLKIARALLDAESVIEQAKGLVPMKPDLRAPLDVLIGLYNAVQDDYLVYHRAVVTGTAPDPATLIARVSDISAAVAELVGQVK